MLFRSHCVRHSFPTRRSSDLKAEKNPWRSNTLEWTTESPPPHGNWPSDALPTVYRSPYEYSHPDRKEDYWPQNESA